MARNTQTAIEDDEELRNSRATDTRGYEEASDEDRLSILRNEMINAALPTVPQIVGFHTCWLSTTNQYDTIARRLRLGYTPVKPEDVPDIDFQAATMSDGAYAGCIAVNEMILFKVSESFYQKMMKLQHHDMPQEEEDKLKQNIQKMKDGSLSQGHSLVREIGDGTEELLKQPGRKVRQFQ